MNQQIEATEQIEHIKALIATADFALITANIEQVYILIDGIYKAVDDTQKANINEVWQRVLDIYEKSGIQHEIIAGATGAMDAYKVQRDAVADELSKLVTALGDMDLSHPKVREVYGSLEDYVIEAADEEVSNMYYELHWEISAVAETFGVEVDGSDVLDVILGREEMNPAQKAAYVNFLTEMAGGQ
jgi:hypothetical protein